MSVSLEKLRTIIGKKEILVYGAGNQGRGTRKALNDQGFQPSGFIDKNPELQNLVLAGLPVHPPEYIMRKDAVDKFFIVIASFFFEREIAENLDSWGFTKGLGYVSYSALKPHDYVVEVSGACNLRCISCPRAARGPISRSSSMMSMANFKEVLAKIRREDPFVANIQLYQWGEPTLNRDLPDMIQYARANGFLCGVSSNLNHQADFRALIEAHPECLRISASGIGGAYGVTHTGGNWDTFLANIKIISGLRREIYPEMKVELYYHRYKHSIGETQDQVLELCRQLGLEFHPVPAYLISLDDVLAYCEGRPLPDSAKLARQLLMIDLDEGLYLAGKERSLGCDAFRVLMINADLSVSNCMMYYDPDGNTIVENFLETSLSEIEARRQETPLCIKCKKFGIHRYCGIYAKISEEARN